MNKLLCIILMLGLACGGTGCAVFKNPFKSWTKAENKVEVAQKKIDANQDQIIEEGKKYVYATKLALDADPSTNQFHKVETSLNDKAVATLGTPTLDQITALETMVKNLVSTNAETIKKGEKQLAAMNEKVGELQAENASLQTKLGVAQEKLQKVGEENSAMAQKWNRLMRLFWYIVYGIIAVIVIKVLSAVLPPPYNSIVSIVAVPIGLVIKGIQACIPEAKKAAGVVASQTYETTKLALTHVVQGIEDFKAQQKDTTTKEALATALKDNTSKEVTRPVITQTKQELGYV